MKTKVSGFGFRVSGSGFWVSASHLSHVTRHLSLFILASSFFILISSCRHYNTQQSEQDKTLVGQQQQEALMRVNQQLVEEDTKEIETFAARRGWQMQTTESGLWYMVYKNGQGEKAVVGKIATLAYTVSLLDSTVCYSSEQSGPKTIRLGKRDAEPGLEEGVMLMHVGDKVRLILPPYLAHGLTGDGNCIPRRAIILYDVELLGLK